ncbi:hypothetical protein GURASL_35420 [Geotalea uraniireducens]|uniref:Uncharacterized protein n=1 Tax=Geotalea uraniireducens TaxID=351604 RepID=A0ABM8EPS2_9BACT|nr:hypothetical protein GURASL_35420 [Geotalea uraniireducens]
MLDPIATAAKSTEETRPAITVSTKPIADWESWAAISGNESFVRAANSPESCRSIVRCVFVMIGSDGANGARKKKDRASAQSVTQSFIIPGYFFY